MPKLVNTAQIEDRANRLQHVFGRPRTLGEVENRIAIEPDATRRQQLIHIKAYLERLDERIRNVQQSGTPGAVDRLMQKTGKEIKGITFRFAKSHGHPPSGYPELLYFMGSQLDAEGNLLKETFNTAAQPELGYVDLHRQMSGIKESDFELPAALVESHDVTNHIFAKLEAWFKIAESREIQTLKDRIAHYVNLNQGEAVDYLITKAAEYIGIDQDERKILLRTLSDHAKMIKAETDPAKKIPFFSLATMLSEPSSLIREKYDALSCDLWMSFEQSLGLDEFDQLKSTFDTDTYIKIREFLSYEISDIPSLNLAAAKMTLLYPEYTDFVSFIKKYAAYSSENKSLSLAELIDISNFAISNINYPELGKQLLTGPKSTIVYFKCCQWLNDLPLTPKGKLRTKDIDRQLFQPIGKIDVLFTDAELQQYKDLQIVRDLIEGRKMMKECQEEYQKEYQKEYGDAPREDKIKGLLPEMFLDGVEFDMPGCELSRVSFDDPRYFHLGRAAKDVCEHAGGHWSEPLRDSWIHQTSAYYAIKDKDRNILAYVWIRADMSEDIVLDGPESDMEATGIKTEHWYKIRELLREKYIKDSTLFNDVTFGPSQTYRDLIADAKTTIPNEMQRGHVKKIGPDQIATEAKLVEKIIEISGPVAPLEAETIERLQRLRGKTASDPEPNGP